MSWQVEHGDCLAVLRACPSNVVDALVTDPPAGIGFMGKTWDKPTSYGFAGERLGAPPGVNLARNPTCKACGGRKRAGPATRGCVCASPDWNEIELRLRDREAFVSFLRDVMREALRLMKPGAHGLVWALPRTSHWTATALEDAGFEVRDVVNHLFGTGFPKSLNLGDGVGTALKPAAEHWILVRKPCDGTTTDTFERWGTGGLEIDACRIPHASAADLAAHEKMVAAIKARGGSMEGSWKNSSDLSGANDVNTAGRWPAHVVLSHSEVCGDACAPDCAVRALDEQAGERKSGSRAPGVRKGLGYRGAEGDGGPAIATSSGGASRFFYCAKPSPAERDLGLDAFPLKSGKELCRDANTKGAQSPRAGAGRTSAGRRNHHPTVKSIALMRWLVRLVTPPGGVVLDPFAGSGTTGCAAVLEGLNFSGIEQDPEYVTIARARISVASRGCQGSSEHAPNQHRQGADTDSGHAQPRAGRPPI